MKKRNTTQRSIHLTATDIERADYLTTMMEMSFSAMVRALMKDACETIKRGLGHNEKKDAPDAQPGL